MATCEETMQKALVALLHMCNTTSAKEDCDGMIVKEAIDMLRHELKPKTRKVKLLAWFCGGIEHGSLFWTKENAVQLNHWKRVPSEDKEIEIEE